MIHIFLFLIGHWIIMILVRHAYLVPIKQAADLRTIVAAIQNRRERCQTKNKHKQKR